MFVHKKRKNSHASPSPKFNNFDGTSNRRTAMPLLALLGAGTAIAISIYSGLWGKCIPFLIQREKISLQKIDDDGTNEDYEKKEDRISQLSDDLLSLILSRLSLVDLAKGRIVSRRWRSISMLRTELSFDCLDMFYNDIRGAKCHSNTCRKVKHRYLEAVDETLRLYSGQRLTLVMIKCCFREEKLLSYYLGRWIEYCAFAGVEDLRLEFNCDVATPWSVSKADVVNSNLFPSHPAFKILYQVVPLEFLDLPCFQGQLKSVKFLSLCCIRLDNRKLPSILSSLSELTNLTIKYCTLDPHICVFGPSSLQVLRVNRCTGVREIEIGLTNLRDLDLFSVSPDIVYKLSCVPNLHSLALNVIGRGTVSYFFGEVVKRCPDLEDLVFQTNTDEVPYAPLRMFVSNKIRRMCLMLVVDSQINLLNITSILSSCPLLLSLRVWAPGNTRNDRTEVWPPACHTHLKRVAIHGFAETRNQIQFVAYLLRSAPTLERMSINELRINHLEYGRTYVPKYEVVEVEYKRGKRICEQLLDEQVSSECLSKVLIF